MEVARLQPLPARYVTRRELSELLGVSISTVDRMREMGMPSVVFCKSARRFELNQALSWARAQST